jgi:rSAM/selenodomain-associated transferase 1
LKNKNYCILFFVKYPEKGKVKSRLSSELNENFTKNLYKMFVKDLLFTLNKAKYPKIICYYPKKNIDKFKAWLGKNYRYYAQSGENLGERMKSCFEFAFKQNFEKVIVIGSDSPDLSENILNTAFSSLNDNDTVIGPTYDGGYYLLGFKKNSYSPEVFNGINWSTKTVFEETMNKLNSENIKTKVLDYWGDIDTINDLNQFYKKYKDIKNYNSETITFLKKNNF